MKIFWKDLKQNGLVYGASILSLALTFLFYQRLIGAYATVFLASALFSYALCTALCKKAQKLYFRHEKDGSLTDYRAFWFSVAICAPIYWCWAVVGLIPITCAEAWLVTGLPLHLIGWMPLWEVAKTARCKVAFWCLQMVLYLILFVFCQWIVEYLI